MYAIINSEGVLLEIEARDLPLDELIHRDMWHLYIPISEGDDVKPGDIWHSDKGAWESVDVAVQDDAIVPAPVEALSPEQISAQLLSIKADADALTDAFAEILGVMA